MNYQNLRRNIVMSGIVGIVSNEPVILEIVKGLNRLQARGTRLSCIITKNNQEHTNLMQQGLVKDLFNKTAALHELKGNMAIGFVGNHLSSPDPNESDSHPATLRLADGHRCSVCFSGLMTNYKTLRERLETEGIILAGKSFADLIIHLIHMASGDGIIEKTFKAFKEIRGSFSLVMMFGEYIIAARDIRGSRPLSIGALPNGGYIFASETCAFGSIGASYIREVEPGEILVATSNGLTSDFFSAATPQAQCSMELISRASPESRVYGYGVAPFRRELGRELGRQNNLRADYIISSPKASRDIAIGLSEASGKPVVPAIVRYDNVLKHFYPNATSYLAVRFGLLQDLLTSGSVALIDDFMQSTDTVKFFIHLLRTSGMIERIDLLTTCGLVNKSRCKFRRGSRIIEPGKYNRLKVKNLAEYLDVDSFSFLSVESIKRILGKNARDFCFACLNGS